MQPTLVRLNVSGKSAVFLFIFDSDTSEKPLFVYKRIVCRPNVRKTCDSNHKSIFSDQKIIYLKSQKSLKLEQTKLYKSWYLNINVMCKIC